MGAEPPCGSNISLCGFAAFAIELAIREGELVTHAEPHSWRQAGLAISHQGLVRTFPSPLSCTGSLAATN